MSNDTAKEAWGLVFRIAMENRSGLLDELEALDLTFMQAHVLRALEPGSERPMRDLAGVLKCDASNVTGIVDRLEARGLVERRSAANDRRVRTLALTPAGLALRERAWAVFREPPDSIKRLSSADRRALRDILRRAVPD